MTIKLFKSEHTSKYYSRFIELMQKKKKKNDG